MKKLIIFATTLLSISNLNAQTIEGSCIFKDILSTNIKYVHPVYKVSTNYFFEKYSKEAYALVTWQFDQETTRNCFEAAKEKFPNNKIMIPPVSLSQVELKILGSNTYKNIDLFPMANGQWTGSTQMIRIPYSSKDMITHAVENKLSTVEFNGDPRMRITLTEKKPVATIKCTDKEEEAGVLNLFKRLKFVKEKADLMALSDGVKTEEALEDFFNQCVEFNSVNAESFSEFNSEQKIYSRILKGEFSLIGSKQKDIYEKMKGFLVESTSIQSI